MSKSNSIAHLPACDQQFIREAAARRVQLGRDLARATAARRARMLADMPAADRADFSAMMGWNR